MRSRVGNRRSAAAVVAPFRLPAVRPKHQPRSTEGPNHSGPARWLPPSIQCSATMTTPKVQAGFFAILPITRRLSANNLPNSSQNGRSSDTRQQAGQRIFNRLFANSGPIPGEMTGAGFTPGVAPSPGKTDRANRFFHRTSGWPSNARDRHRPVRPAMHQSPLGHGSRRGFRNSTMAIKRRLRYTKHIHLGCIGISHEPPIKPS